MLRRLGAGRFREDLSGTDPGHLPRRGALEAREDDTPRWRSPREEHALRKVFNRVDISGDGHISVIEAIGAPRRTKFDGHRARGCWASTT